MTERSFDAVLSDFVREFAKARTRRPGSILVRLSDKDEGDYYLHSTGTSCELSREPAGEPPQVEVIGKADDIHAILEKQKEGRQQYYAGGMLVRGDLRYLSAIAHEMGLIKEPF